jgi:sugar/nucleoside kinase (ribokinase family)
LYDVVLKEIDRQLRRLHDENEAYYMTLKKAWCAAREWAATGRRPLQGTSVLMPYVGSGLNRLAEGGLGSWEELVKEVAKQCPSLGSEHQIRRSGLTMPQQLEIYLRTAATDTEARGNIFGAFQTAFATQGKPSTFHKRLAKMFPVLLTTNYNDLLTASDPSKKTVIDLTAPDCNPNLTVPSICHLHGRWASGMRREELESRIFAGVGLHEESARPCLVLTENQYHRLYSDPKFRGALTKILAPPHVLLFLGASLATDEAGIHNILTARLLAGGSFSGLYVGVDMDPLKERLLSLRGIQCISLPRAFGFSRRATEVLFHALFDQMEKRFEVKPPSLASPTPVLPGPQILCAGLAAWNRIFSLGSRKWIGTEASYLLQSEDVVEEPGGQHLAPALYLVSRGHRVALATTTGDDALGDQVRKWVTRHVERITRKGTGDLIVWAWQIKGNTRLTTAVTYGGTRVIFDYDGDGLGNLDACSIDWEQLDSLKALYLGAYYLECEEKLLEKLPSVRWRFFETGTRGPKDKSSFERAVNIARQCTHVLSSSGFALRLAGREKLGSSSDSLKCQRRLYEDVVKGKAAIARLALNRLWPKPMDCGNLVVVMGGFGSLVVTRGRPVRRIPAVVVNKKRGRNWLGCGDIFRAEFIHQVLKGASCVRAAKAATNLVANKIQRMPFLPTLQ